MNLVVRRQRQLVGYRRNLLANCEASTKARHQFEAPYNCRFLVLRRYPQDDLAPPQVRILFLMVLLGEEESSCPVKVLLHLPRNHMSHWDVSFQNLLKRNDGVL